jgi:hypothetical protein
MTKKLKLLTALVTITAMLWTVGKAASAHGWGERDDFKLVGGARLVTGGIAPHDVAVDLTSNCGNQAYSPTCYTNAAAFVFSNVVFVPDKNSMTLSEIKTLLTDYNMNGTDCMDGAPRFVIVTNMHNYVANFGKAPFGGNCYYGWQNTGNMTSLTDPTLRWQVDLANTFITWSAVEASHGTEVVTEVAIVLDSGWGAPRGQDVTIDTFTINKEVMNFSEETHDR